MHLEAFHPMGTARISSDPGSGVVSPSGETHDVPGLWIADGSVFPSAIKVNPMITIMGVARRIAAQLSEQLA
jgi:choline dehydrogenase-like flavoprotein